MLACCAEMLNRAAVALLGMIVCKQKATPCGMAFCKHNESMVADYQALVTSALIYSFTSSPATSPPASVTACQCKPYSLRLIEPVI